VNANALFQRRYAALEYRPAPINGSHIWYWSLLPLPDETHALATGHAENKGKASIQARQEARKQGYAITTIRVRHAQFAEAAAQRIHKLMALREADPDDVDPRHYARSTFNWLKTLGERGFALEASRQDSPGFYFKNIGNYQLIVWPNHSHFGAGEPLDELTVQVYTSENGRWELTSSKYVERALLGVRLDQLIAEFSIKEALDPDAVDPKAYTLTTPDFRFAKYADWYAVLTDEHALWNNGLGKIGLNKSGKWRVIDATGVPTKIFKGKTYSTAMDVAMALWLETNKRVTETLDPDAVDPRQFIKTTFETKARVDKLMWAMDSVGLRAIGVCRHENKWRVYGHVYATARGAKIKVNKALNQFGLKPNGPVTWVQLSFDNQAAVNRGFEFELPRHALEYNTAAHDAVKPPGSRTFLHV
jgi:hypothetical protein